MSVGPSSTNVSTNRSGVPRTSRKCTKWMRPAAPNRRIAAGRSSVIRATFPWHRVMPFAGLGWSSNTRSYASSVRTIRAIPRSGERGGSSGWSASRTPASSATARRAGGTSRGSPRDAPRRRERPARPARPARRKDRSRSPPLRRGRGDGARGPRPRDDRHPVVTEHFDPEPSHRPDELEHRLELVLAPREPEPEPVHRRVVLDHGQPQTGVLHLLAEERERPVAPRRLGRVRPPVAEAAWEHADRLLDPDLPELIPGRRAPRLEQDLGEAQHVRSS